MPLGEDVHFRLWAGFKSTDPCLGFYDPRTGRVSPTPSDASDQPALDVTVGDELLIQANSISI